MNFSSASSSGSATTHLLRTFPKHCRWVRPSGHDREPVRHISRTPLILPDIPSRTPIFRTPVCRHSTLKVPEWKTNLSKLKDMQYDVYQGRILQEGDFIEHITTELATILTRPQQNAYELHAIAKFIRLFGHFRMCPYNETFFNSISDILTETKDETLLKIILPSFIWVCGRRHHYPPTLMTHASQFLLDSLNELTTTDVSMIVHACGKLNHHIPGLVQRVETWFLKEHDMAFENHLPWTLTWAGMVFGDYPKEMLVQLLDDEYIEGCVRSNRNFLLIILLQLKIGLNKECPDLQLGLGWDTDHQKRQWGLCRAAMRGISDKMLQRSYLDKIDGCYSIKRSLFGSNLSRAIRTALGGAKCVLSEPLSLNGYNFDFEVLLDRHGNPIQIPLEWKYKSPEVLESSIGANRVRRKRLEKVPDDLLASMRQTEGNNADVGSDELDVKASLGEYRRAMTINVASDWGMKFKDLPYPAARKLLIEADGIFHYAQNDNSHTLGSSVLKKRQVEALGWEVLNVDYKVWRELASGDAQAEYIKSLIYKLPSPNSIVDTNSSAAHSN